MSLYQVPEIHGNDYLTKFCASAAMLLIGHVAGTQFLAHSFLYDAQLGAGWHGIYPPWNIWKWTWQWWGVTDQVVRHAFRIADTFALGCAFGAIIAWSPKKRKLLNDSLKDIHGSAHFATAEEIKESRLLQYQHGVYLGAWVEKKGFFGWGRKVRYLMHDGPEHIIGIAPNRSGKGVGLVIPSLLAWQESAVIFDMKRENWDHTAGYRETLGPVFRMEFTDSASSRWNALAEVRINTEKDVIDANNIALVLTQDGINKSQPHFDESASLLLTGMILHACYYMQNERGRAACLADIWSMLTDPAMPFDQRLQEMLTYRHLDTGTHPAVAQVARDMIDRLNISEEEFGGDLATLKTKLKIFLDPVLSKQTSVSDFCIQDVVNHRNPVSVYIVVPPSDIDRLRPIVRVFLTLLTDHLTEDLEKAKQYKHRVLLMIDEFPILNRLKVFAKGLSYIAGYGLKAYIIAQDYVQITDIYGDKEAITSNCDGRVIMPPNKYETAEAVSRWTGDTTVAHEHVSHSGGKAALWMKNVTVSGSHVKRRLITPEELLYELKRPRREGEGKDEKITAPGQMLIFSGGTPPILAEQILFFKDREFIRRSGIKPPEKLIGLLDGEVDIQQEPPDLTIFPDNDSVTTEMMEPEDDDQTMVAAAVDGWTDVV